MHVLAGISPDSKRAFVLNSSYYLFGDKERKGDNLFYFSESISYLEQDYCISFKSSSFKPFLNDIGIVVISLSITVV